MFPSGIKSGTMRLAARAGNLGVDLLSRLNARHIRAMANQPKPPRWLVAMPDQVEAHTRGTLAPRLQHVLFTLTGVRPDEADKLEIARVISTGIAEGIFDSYGRAIYINADRIDHLLCRLDHLNVFRTAGVNMSTMAPDEFRAYSDRFTRIAQDNHILRRYYYGELLTTADRDDRDLPRGYYRETEYVVKARDGQRLTLTRIVNQDKVQTNDDRPSVLLIPGLACKGKIFDLNDTISLALELADQGNWVYLFEPRNLGKNFNPEEYDYGASIDTTVSNDLPAIVDFINKRPRQHKPVVLVGYSKGGIEAEFMLVRQAAKLRDRLGEIAARLGQPVFDQIGKTTAEIAAYLAGAAAAAVEQTSAARIETEALISRARIHLDMLMSVKGVITLGSPKIFDKNSHVIFPAVLSLEHLLPALRFTRVPVNLAKSFIELFPVIANVLRLLIVANNFEEPKEFLQELALNGTDDFALGVGYQLLKAVYGGQGVKRLDHGRLNYSAHLHLIPTDIPLYHIVGDSDPLAPPYNLAFIDRRYSRGQALDFSGFREYAHARRGVRRLSPDTDIEAFDIQPEKSTVQGFLIPGVGHLDLFYGKTADRLIRPLLERLVGAVWQA